MVDSGGAFGALLIITDLSKALDCIPHDLIIAKLEAYGFEMNALKLIYYMNIYQIGQIISLKALILQVMRMILLCTL